MLSSLMSQFQVFTLVFTEIMFFGGVLLSEFCFTAV